MQSDYRGDRIDIPTKKPRKSKKNPNPPLSDEQKATNKVLSQIRIFIEHAIGGMKRSNILVHVFRNRKADFEDDAVGICAGLWNFALSYYFDCLKTLVSICLMEPRGYAVASDRGVQVRCVVNASPVHAASVTSSRIDMH